MALNFVAIDFETANTSRNSPCAMGITRVENGGVTSHRKELFRPPVGLDDDLDLEEFFDPFCMSIHGIGPDDVRDKPRFEDIWLDLYDNEIRGNIVVAHNAAFDIGVMRQATELSFETNRNPRFATWPEADYLCTLVLSRRAYDLPSYRLPYVAEAAEVELGEYHDPGEDARVAAEILLAIAKSANTEDLAELAEMYGVMLGSLKPLEWEGCRRSRSQSSHGRAGGLGLVAPSPNPNADPDHPLYGQFIVFTGTLGSMTRQQAFDLSASVGAECQNAVTKKTNVLVMGEQDAARLRPGSTLSSKARKAFDLRTNGQEIEVMSEDDFLGLVADTRASGIRAITSPGG
jgi:DNA polymerase-3 subunit epsilon